KPGGVAHYSMVSGALPLDELPVVEANKDSRHSFVKFQVEILTPGEVTLRFDDGNGITAWSEAGALVIQENKLTTPLTQGVHHIVLAVDRNLRNEGSLRVQLTDDG